MEKGYHTRVGRPSRETPVKEDPVEPLIIIGGRVPPHNCPACGKGQDPLVLQTEPTHVRVRCRSCAKIYQYFHAKTRTVVE